MFREKEGEVIEGSLITKNFFYSPRKKKVAKKQENRFCGRGCVLSSINSFFCVLFILASPIITITILIYYHSFPLFETPFFPSFSPSPKHPCVYMEWVNQKKDLCSIEEYVRNTYLGSSVTTEMSLLTFEECRNLG